MRICPNCHEEVESNFEICWNCNYSFSEKRIIEFPSEKKEKARYSINCLRCDVEMRYSGKFRFHEGANMGVLGNLFEFFQNREAFDLYVCPKCGKVEFFTPLTERP